MISMPSREIWSGRSAKIDVKLAELAARSSWIAVGNTAVRERS